MPHVTAPIKTPALTFSSDLSGGDTLSFEIVPLQLSNSVGVIRTLCSKDFGVIVQDLVFKQYEDFARWIAEDEFRHQAPRLFSEISRVFHSILHSAKTP